MSGVAVPPALEPKLDELVERAAREWDEPVETVRRFVECCVLQLGIEAVQKQLEKDRDFAQRMGWPA